MCSILVITCSSDKDDQSDEIVIPSSAWEQTVTLKQLSAPIADIQNSATWLSVEKQSYYSSSPQVKLRAGENVSSNRRSCLVMIADTLGNTVSLSVVQKSSDEDRQEKSGNDIDSLYDSKSEQPAYGRRRH